MAKKQTRKKAAKKGLWKKTVLPRAVAPYTTVHTGHVYGAAPVEPKPEVAAVEPKVDLDAGRQVVQVGKGLSRAARRIEHLEKQRRG